MAAIDSLLRVMALRDAEAMVISTGQIPSLRRAGQAETMAMPALDPLMVLAFVDELLQPPNRADLDTRGATELTHTPPGGETVGVSIERTAAGYRLVVRRGGSRPNPHPGTISGTGTPRATPRNVTAAAVAAAAAPTGPATEYQVTAPMHARTRTTSTAPLPGPQATPRSSPIPVPYGSTLPSRRVEPEPSLPVASALASLVATAAERRASDILVSSGLAPRLRVDGGIVELDDAPTGEDELYAMLETLAGSEPARAFRDRGAVDFGADVGGQRLRGHAFRHERGSGLVLRLVRADLPTVAGLGLPEDLANLVQHRSGLVLFAGAAGSGKSTTMVALVAHLNRTRARHVITLEDPIEYLHSPERCLVHQREVGRHTPSFADGLRTALREAPDVIVVGELRDPETIATAVTAAETGHLVLATIHAPSAAVAIDRLIDAYPEHQLRHARAQVAAVLRCIVTQYLVPNRSGGRTVAIERVLVTPAVAALIRKNELQMLGSHIQTGRDAGMIPLERSLANLVRARAVETAVARSFALDLDYFESALRS